MHARTAATITLTAALLLSGCGESRSATPAEVVYADAAGNGDPEDLRGVDAVTLADEGHKVCDMLAEGQTVADAVAYLRLGFSSKETGALIGAAPALCPNQKAAIDAGLAALG